MKKYNFQVNPDFPNTSWDECEPIEMEFSSRENAVHAAQLLSAAFSYTEVRMTQGNHKTESGTYICAEQPALAS